MGRTRHKQLPHLWLVGPDPLKKRLHDQFLKSKAQANFRKEGWELERDEYINLWLEGDRYLRKGRRPEDLCMTRIDTTKPWSLENCEIIPRSEHFKERNRKRV